MDERYTFDTEDYNEFRKLENSLKKYNMLAWKYLYFECYEDLKMGIGIGEEIYSDIDGKVITYELNLPTDIHFEKTHGKISLNYTIDHINKVIMLNGFSPEEILIEGYNIELGTHKGTLVSEKSKEKDLFKINLLNAIEKENKLRR